jgi:tetratricopeptide (TPR) repeat protein
MTYIMTGKFAEAIQTCETAVQLTKRSVGFLLAFLGSWYGLAGRIDDAKKILGELQQLAQNAYVSPNSFAGIYFGLGETDKGFDWLEKAVDEREGSTLHIYVNPIYNSLRSYPRFQALLRKMNLES